MAAVFLVGMAAADFILLVDEFPTSGAKYIASDADIVGGGCAANAAYAVARLGGEATLAARLGGDVLADMIIAELAAAGVCTDFMRRSPLGRSSFSSVLVDGRGERQIVNFRGRGLGDDTAWLDRAPRADAVLVDTRWNAGAAAGLRLARQRRIPGIVDAEAPIDTDVLSLASHVAFSRPGLASLVDDADPAKALEKIRGKLPGWACVTDGANGVYFTDGDNIGHIPAFKVETRDTLAAGDIWHGAFALWLGEGGHETDAIRFANAAAALKCTNFGGRRGCPDRAAVEVLLAKDSPSH